MTSDAKPARAPSEGALPSNQAHEAARAWLIEHGNVSFSMSLGSLLDDFAAHRLSTALLNPQAVEAAAKAYAPVAFIDTAGWPEDAAAFQATMKAAQITHMQAALCAAIEAAGAPKVKS